jgi:branched-chain amino acid transport system ATP-binding protein
MSYPCLELRDVTKAFGGLRVTQEVSLSVAQGERHLLLGPNGAGKTTLFNQIAGDLQPDSGDILLDGRSLRGLRTDQRVHLGIARTYQIITLFGEDTLAHNVVLALLGRSKRRWNPLKTVGANDPLWSHARAILHTVGIEHLADRPLAQTSYGERRRLEIAMALAQEPKLLLLDEPMAGLSREERHIIEEVIAAIPRSVTILMIEHDMDIALRFADRITVLDHGTKVSEGNRHTIASDPKVKEIYLGA